MDTQREAQSADLDFCLGISQSISTAFQDVLLDPLGSANRVYKSLSVHLPAYLCIDHAICNHFLPRAAVISRFLKITYKQ
jgi:hypothetical protein